MKRPWRDAWLLSTLTRHFVPGYFHSVSPGRFCFHRIPSPFVLPSLRYGAGLVAPPRYAGPLRSLMNNCETDISSKRGAASGLPTSSRLRRKRRRTGRDDKEASVGVQRLRLKSMRMRSLAERLRRIATDEIRTNEGRWVGPEVGPEGDDDGDDEEEAGYRHRHLRLEAGLQWQQCNQGRIGPLRGGSTCS
jgi:hypothetical protein